VLILAQHLLLYFREPLKIELRQYEIQKFIDVSQPEPGVF